MSEVEYDCLACGACYHGLDVLLDQADQDRFEQRPDLLRKTREYWCGQTVLFMKRDKQHDRCVALDVTPGCWKCTIYDERPQLCRDFQAGSDDCKAARIAKGYPV